MERLEKILPYIISLQKELNNSTAEKLHNTDLRHLLEIAEYFSHSGPVFTVDTIKDEVIVTGIIPIILKPEDISIELKNDILMFIDVLWHEDNWNKKDRQSLRKRIELPFSVDPLTIRATYQNGTLKISAKKHSDEKLIHVKVRFLD